MLEDGMHILLRTTLVTTLVGCGTRIYEDPPDPVETDTDTDTDTDSDTDTDADADADADSDADTDPGTVIISEVVDHPDNANAKFVEIYNASGGTVTLDGWTIRRYANGSTTSQDVTLAGVMAGGQVRVIAQGSGFDDAFGTTADQYDGAISGNGNDVYELHSGVQTVDVYGVIGVDGTGTAWDYENSTARRNQGITVGNPGFDAGEWTITAGADLASPGVR